MHVLVIRSGPRAGERVEIESELIIGREQCDVVIADQELSRRHLALRVRGDGVEVEDLGSTNGSWLGGRRIDAPLLLDTTTTLRAGETELVIEIEPAHDPAATRVQQPAAAAATVVGRPVPATFVPAPHLAGRDAQPPVAVPAFGELTPSRASGRRSGVATRQALPALVTIAIIVAVAVALVVYFATR
jgi:Inner membrane component of T3SS, cytoplasmic domain